MERLIPQQLPLYSYNIASFNSSEHFDINKIEYYVFPLFTEEICPEVSPSADSSLIPAKLYNCFSL